MSKRKKAPSAGQPQPAAEPLPEASAEVADASEPTDAPEAELPAPAEVDQVAEPAEVVAEADAPDAEPTGEAVEEAENAAEAVGDETGDAAEAVGDEAEESAEAVGDEAEDAAGGAGDEPEEAATGPRLVSVSGAPATLPAGDVMRAHLKGLIEALVFVSDHPITIHEIAKTGKADKGLVRALVDELRRDYAHRGFHLDEVAGGLVFRTDATYAPFVRDSVAKKPVRMTRAQLETLAIVAYRQPLTRPEIDDIRGVDTGPVLKMLLERDLIKILGKKDEPGRPLLYGTTPNFLEFFGLKTLKDLPTLREFTELSDDSRRVFDREMTDAGLASEEPPMASRESAAEPAPEGEPVPAEPEGEPVPAEPEASDAPGAESADPVPSTEEAPEVATQSAE